MARTVQLVDGTLIVVRQIAAVGPVVQSGKKKKKMTTFDIVLVGGTKLFPQIEYNEDRIQAERDRAHVIHEIKNTSPERST